MSMQRELSQQMESVAIYEHTSSHSIVVRRPRGEQAAVDGNTSRGMVRSSTDAAAAAATLIIECQDREFTVIKSVICDKSPVFRRMCNGNFRVLETFRFLSCANLEKAKAKRLIFGFNFSFYPLGSLYRSYKSSRRGSRYG